jgi:hypothetical protein
MIQLPNKISLEFLQFVDLLRYPYASTIEKQSFTMRNHRELWT